MSLWRVLGFGLVLSCTLSAAGFSQARIEISHALALHGQPALPLGFTHFPFANPSAPIGGHLRLDSTGTFDSLNPFISKGISAEGINRIYDSLTVASPDEPFTRYGLLAERIERDPNAVSYTHLRAHET